MARRGSLVALLIAALAARAASAGEIVLWHSYRGKEEAAIEALVEEWNSEHPGSPVRSLAVPHEAYASKLTTAIPRGQGPDVFIFAHERIGDWVRTGLLLDLTGDLPEDLRGEDGLTVGGRTYGVALALKSLALFYNRDLLDEPPATTDEMVAIAQGLRDPGAGRFGLAYEAGSFYHHAPWLFGFGGRIFDEEGNPVLDDPANEASLAFVADLTRRDLVPREPTATLVTQLFNEGRAAMVVGGTWFVGEIEGIDYGVAPLPVVSATGRAATPLLTIEAAMVSSRTHDQAGSIAFALFLALEGARTRLEIGRQVVASAELAGGMPPDLEQLRLQAGRAVLMPNNPVMRSVWEPASRALRSVLRGSASPRDALARAQRELRAVTRPPPPQASPAPYVAALGILLAALGAWLFARSRRKRLLGEALASLHAYAYVLPTAAAMLVLVIVPFLVGTAVAFFSHSEGRFTFVGLANFADILLCRQYPATDPLSFYFTLAVTILWTVANVLLHVSIGLALAMALRSPWLRLRSVYRVLLILPWAVPSYITALIWKGMFHAQFGAINGLLGLLGLEPVSWFSGFWTAFAANLATNTWLGFPFMMVVALGALQAIPRELEEAAEMDGASAWTRFTRVVLPLIRPALVPAVILGSVWTFNMFNIIYLVSGGEPDGSTEILISEAYRWAFSRQEQYGYAAAYAVLIFLALVAYTRFTRRLTAGLRDA